MSIKTTAEIDHLEFEPKVDTVKFRFKNKEGDSTVLIYEKRVYSFLILSVGINFSKSNEYDYHAKITYKKNHSCFLGFNREFISGEKFVYDIFNAIRKRNYIDTIKYFDIRGGSFSKSINIMDIKDDYIREGLIEMLKIACVDMNL